MKKKIIIADLILIALITFVLIIAIWATKNWAFVERSAVISIISFVAIGGIPVINSLFSEIPKFEVSNPRVEIERVVDRVSRVSIAKTEKHDVETKAVYIDVKNKNPDADLTDCKIGIATEIGDWNTLNLKNLIPDIPQKIPLLRIFPDGFIVSLFQSKNGVKLDVGKVYDLDIRFFGERFVNKKVCHMELDLSSWSDYNLCFKSHWRIFKKHSHMRRIMKIHKNGNAK